MTIFTLSLLLSFANAAFALVYAAAHVPAPVPGVPDPDEVGADDVLETRVVVVVMRVGEEVVTELLLDVLVDVRAVVVVEAAPGTHWK